MTSPALWLAAREVIGRRARVALAAAVVAALAAAVVAIELVSRAREEAVAAQIDAMGPALTIVPAGTSSSALARYEIAGALPPGTEAGVREALGRDLRAIERRLVLHREVAGLAVPVVGEEHGAASGAGPLAAAGSEVARRLGDTSIVSVGETALRVARVLPSTGSIEDLALFVPMGTARALAAQDGPNVLRLFLRAGASPRAAEAKLVRASVGAAVIRTDRGEVADQATHESLSRHRSVAYALMATVALLCLLIAAHLDASERRVELATLTAIGASRATVLGVLVSRSALVASAGAVAGALGGALLASIQGDASIALLAHGWALGVATIGSAIVTGVIAAVPAAVAVSLRDPVRELQEG